MNRANLYNSTPKIFINQQLVCLTLFCLQPLEITAATIVNVQTTLGNFRLELFEDKAPATVAHFLAHIEAGTYQFTMIHQVSNLIAAGGQYFYNSCSEGPVVVPGIGFIPAERTGLANTTSTIAMMRNLSDSSTVGSEWVINLGKNEAIYDANSKPVVFGEVVEGLDTVDQIVDSWRVPLDISPSVPTVNYDGNLIVDCSIFNRDNVIKTAMQVVSIDKPVTQISPIVFDPATAMLHIKVNAGSTGLFSLSLMLQSESPAILQVQPETVTTLNSTVGGMAIFDAGTGNLTLPDIVVNGQSAYSDVILRLTDTENLFFTLISAGSP